MILCDTNVLIEFYKGNDSVTKVFADVGLPNLAVSVITVGELYYGAKDKREFAQITKHLKMLNQIDVDADVCNIFLELM